MNGTPLPSQPYRMILALHEMENAGAWVTLALNVLPAGGELHLVGLVTIPEGVTLSEGATQAQQWRDTFSPFAAAHPEIYDEVRARVDYEPMARVIEDCTSQNINLLMVQWAGPNDKTGGLPSEDILKKTPCDLVLVCGEFWGTEGPVLLSLRGGPNLTLGFEMAKAIAENDSITLFHAADRPSSAPDLQLLMHSAPEITRMVTATGDVQQGILHEADGHRAIVLGASFTGPSELVQRLKTQTNAALILVRARQQEPIPFHAPRRGIFGRRRPATKEIRTEDISTQVDRWFAENTFHSNEFADLNSLLALKEKQGVTISIGLPALNEEKTVGKVIGLLKKSLMEDLPLVDEIVLIDSMSTDKTVEIAESMGVPVYRHPEILPEVGSNRGKGEALWKSLYALKGDIVAWIDTDITNIHPRFIYGILGPLLKRPDVQYVKGFYQRPIKVGDQLQAYGGGRVTELVARPWFNLFYPELSGIVQPLSGEYAGRRTALEKMPFFSGYGVETGLMIDLLDAYGLQGIAQTDLEERVHHNQPLVGLSKMSFAILQVFIMRLEKRYGVQLLDKANRTMKIVAQGPERFALDVAEIGDVERPPINTLPAYREKFS